MFKSLKQMFGGSNAKRQILAPVSDRVVPMSEVNDPTFSQEILNRDVTVVPSEGKMVAPASGEVVAMFETKHAVSTHTEDDTELIIHIDLDTVNLRGEHFTAHVAQGGHIKVGDVLIEFDMGATRETSYNVITPIVICNAPDFPNMVCHAGMEIKVLGPVIDL